MTRRIIGCAIYLFLISPLVPVGLVIDGAIWLGAKAEQFGDWCSDKFTESWTDWALKVARRAVRL